MVYHGASIGLFNLMYASCVHMCLCMAATNHTQRMTSCSCANLRTEYWHSIELNLTSKDVCTMVDLCAFMMMLLYCSTRPAFRILEMSCWLYLHALWLLLQLPWWHWFHLHQSCSHVLVQPALSIRDSSQPIKQHGLHCMQSCQLVLRSKNR